MGDYNDDAPPPGFSASIMRAPALKDERSAASVDKGFRRDKASGWSQCDWRDRGSGDTHPAQLQSSSSPFRGDRRPGSSSSAVPGFADGVPGFQSVKSEPLSSSSSSFRKARWVKGTTITTTAAAAARVVYVCMYMWPCRPDDRPPAPLPPSRSRDKRSRSPVAVKREPPADRGNSSDDRKRPRPDDRPPDRDRPMADVKQEQRPARAERPAEDQVVEVPIVLGYKQFTNGRELLLHFAKLVITWPPGVPLNEIEKAQVVDLIKMGRPEDAARKLGDDLSPKSITIK